jgi:hypothetical protein
MTKKLYCSITGDWSYASDERVAKLAALHGGSEAGLKDPTTGYMSREGKKLVEAHGGDRNAARAAANAERKNKISCIVTGERLYISDARMAHKTTKLGVSETELRATYVSRVASRLRKDLAVKVDATKTFDTLTPDQRHEIDAQIAEMGQTGSLPAPAAPKGSKVKVVAPAAPVAPVPQGDVVMDEVSQAAPVVMETVTAPVAEIDPLRHIEGESASDRKNRIKREKRSVAKVS